MAKIASQQAKDKKLKREPLSTTIMLEDESEDVIETMLETLQSGGGNQVKKRKLTHYGHVVSSRHSYPFCIWLNLIVSSSYIY